MRDPIPCLISAAALLLLPGASVSAQLTLHGEAGAVFPVGAFADVAQTGVRLAAGVALWPEVSGPVFGGDVWFARVVHRAGDARSLLAGLTAWAAYSLRADPVILTPSVGLGAMTHARSSGDFPGLDTTRGGLGARLALRLSVPVGRARVFAAGGYEKGLGALGTSAFPTDFGTVSAGLMLPLGG